MENILERRENMLHCPSLYGKKPPQFNKNKKIIATLNRAAAAQREGAGRQPSAKSFTAGFFVLSTGRRVYKVVGLPLVQRGASTTAKRRLTAYRIKKGLYRH
jgi:hypothetical protein